MIVKIVIAVVFILVVVSLLRPPSKNNLLVRIGKTQIKVEEAKTKTEHNRGLSGRNSIPFDSGMYFIFEKEGIYSFWMRGMKFPLDFIWVKGGRVIDTTEQVGIPVSNASNLLIYQPREVVDGVIEVNGGVVEAQGIKIGDKFEVIK